MCHFSVTSKQLSVFFWGCVLCLCGCSGLRYGATEVQKANAWRHREVCAAASDAAVDEEASEVLCGLTELAAAQSEAFVIDYGLPETLPSPLPPSGYSPLAGGELSALAEQAKVDSAKRPDIWVLADNALELGIALAGLIGGVYGVRVAGYLKTARKKSKAIKEIVEGNELFKQLYPEQAERFKEAQGKQSRETKRLVTAVKTG